MSDMDTAAAKAAAEEGTVLTVPTDQEIWDELLAERNKGSADEDEPVSDWTTSHDSDGTTDAADDAATAQAADPAQTDQSAAQSSEALETAGTQPAEPATKEDIEKQEHKVRSETGRAAALERKGRYEEAAKVRRRVQSLANELSALRKSKEKLSASQKDTPDLQTLREEFPAVHQSMEASRQSQEEALTAREEVLANDYANHVDEQTRLVTEAIPDWREMMRDEQTLQHLKDFLHPSNATEAQIQGFRENNQYFTNAASAIESFKAFQDYLSSVQEPQETAQTGQTDSDAAPPSDKSGQAAAAAEATPSGVSTETRTETNALQESRRKRQMEGAASTSSPHPAVSSSEPPDDAPPEVLWDYTRRLRERKNK